MVTQRRLHKLGLYAWMDGFAIYCPKDYPIDQFAFGEFREKTNTPKDALRNIEEIDWSKDHNYTDLGL